MVLKLFLKFQERFTQDMQPHYVYSPREMTRWVTYSVTWIKGTVSRDGYFFEGLDILISTFCACADGFQGLLKASFALLYTIINFLFAYLKSLINFENAYWNLTQNSFLCDWSMTSSADLNFSQAASDMILQNHKRLPVSVFSVKIAALGPLKRVRVLEGFSQ